LNIEVLEIRRPIVPVPDRLWMDAGVPLTAKRSSDRCWDILQTNGDVVLTLQL
jgi:hypothetical protein